MRPLSHAGRSCSPPLRRGLRCARRAFARCPSGSASSRRTLGPRHATGQGMRRADARRPCTCEDMPSVRGRACSALGVMA